MLRPATRRLVRRVETAAAAWLRHNGLRDRRQVGMAFELIMHKAGTTEALPEGQCAVQKGGRVCFVYRDLMKAGIKDECFVLIDRDQKMIGIRKPNPEEGAATFKLSGRGLCRGCSMRQAFKLIGLMRTSAWGGFRSSTSRGCCTSCRR